MATGSSPDRSERREAEPMGNANIDEVPGTPADAVGAPDEAAAEAEDEKPAKRPKRKHGPVMRKQAAVRKELKEFLKTDLRDEFDVESVMAHLEEIEDCDVAGVSEETRTMRFLVVLANFLGTDKDVPPQIRELFPKDDIPTTFEDLEERVRDGSREFERIVLRRLRRNKDKKSLQAVGIKDGEITTPESKDIFAKVVHRYTFADTLGLLGHAIHEGAATPDEDDEEDGDVIKRRTLREKVVVIKAKLRTEERKEKSLLVQLSLSKREKIVSAALTAGKYGVPAVAAVAIGWPWGLAAIPAVWGLKWAGRAAQALTGVKLSQWLATRMGTEEERRALKEKFKTSHALAAWWRSDHSMKDIMKARLSEVPPEEEFKLPEPREGERGLTEHGEHQRRAEAAIKRACLDVIRESE